MPQCVSMPTEKILIMRTAEGKWATLGIGKGVRGKGTRAQHDSDRLPVIWLRFSGGGTGMCVQWTLGRSVYSPVWTEKECASSSILLFVQRVWTYLSIVVSGPWSNN